MSWIWDEEWGAWTRPVGDGTTAAELYPNDIADFPPLVEIQEERDRLLAIVKRLCGAAGDKGTNWWYPDCEYDPPHWDLMADTAYPTIQRTEPMDPEDAALIRLAVGIE